MGISKVVCAGTADGRVFRVFYPPYDFSAEAIADVIRAQTEAGGMDVVVEVCPVSVLEPDNLCEFIDECKGRLKVNAPEPFPAGCLFPPPNAYGK